MFAITSSHDAWIIAGDLTGATVAQLDEVLTEAADPVVLDLGELRRLDLAGASCLRRWLSSGATVRRMSPFVYLLLQTEPTPPPPLPRRSERP